MTRPPIIWSVAGNDSGGGAGLSADQRAADAFGVHLCPVLASVTAQNSVAVQRVAPLSPELLDAQLAALADDLPPLAIKTGLLGGATQIRLLAQWVDRLRRQASLALVVDPVLAASSGAALADPDTLQAYRDELLPRATLVTPNRHEARLLLGAAATESVPAQARALRRLGAGAVCITGGDSADASGQALDWLDCDHASGWMAAARWMTPHDHGTGCTFATGAAAALALGFVAADAALLAKMCTGNALRHGHAAGAGAGPALARAGFGCDPTLLPTLSWGEQHGPAAAATTTLRPLGLYAIVDSAERVQQVLAAGVRSVQLRIKTPLVADAAWHTALRAAIARSIEACRAAAAELFINDHWQLACELGAGGIHLGQEDLLALGDAGRAELRASGLALGVSSHSLWELCRARALAPRYIACGPVWPTLTKRMPWRPQGMHNLAWWQTMAGRPLVAIGGILQPEQVRAAASTGVDGVCIVRALGDDPAAALPALQRAFDSGRACATQAGCPALPRPSLTPGDAVQQRPT